MDEDDSQPKVLYSIIFVSNSTDSVDVRLSTDDILLEEYYPPLNEAFECAPQEKIVRKWELARPSFTELTNYIQNDEATFDLSRLKS